MANGNTANNRQPYMFNSKELDETGLYYYGARYYNPRSGQWISPDPILAAYVRGNVNAGVLTPANLGLYTYTWNNPLRLRDPNGKEPVELTIGAIVGAAVVATAVAIYIQQPAYQRSASAALNAAVARVTDFIKGKEGEPAIVMPAPAPAGGVTVPAPDVPVVPAVGSSGDKKEAPAEAVPVGVSASNPSLTSGGTAESTAHGQQRADEARAGDTHRQVGDPNRVRRQGRQFVDTETGNTVYVDGNRVVITNSEGKVVTQFKNPRANTQQRIRSGKWKPAGEE